MRKDSILVETREDQTGLWVFLVRNGHCFYRSLSVSSWTLGINIRLILLCTSYRIVIMMQSR